MPAFVEATVTANAPKEAVWKVLADFPNIANYTDTVRSSHSTSENDFEVGATRHCELAPAGSADETITDIKQGESIVISVSGAGGGPIKESTTTFSISEIDAERSRLTMSAEIQPKGGIFAGIISKILERRLPKRAQTVVSDLATSAEKMA